MKYKLADIATIVMGGTPSTSNPDYWNGDILWVTPKDLSLLNGGKYIYATTSHISDYGLKNSSAKIVPAGSIILSTRAPVGYLGIAKFPMATNQGIKALIANEEIVINEYLYYLLQTQTANLEARAGGSTFRELTTESLKNYEIDLPPMSVQHSITNILGSIDKKIEINKRKIAKLEAIAVNYMDYWYSNHTTFNVKLENLVVSTKNAIVDGPFGTQMKIEDYVSFGIPIIEMEYLNGFTISAPIQHFITEEKYNTVSRSTALSGDVILSKTGTLGLLGVIPQHIKRSIIVSRLAKITPDTDKISPYTLLILLKRLGKNGYWEKQSAGSTMPILNIEIIKNAPILICSEMKELNSFIDSVYQRINLLTKGNNNLSTQKNELLPLLMNGQVKVI